MRAGFYNEVAFCFDTDGKDGLYKQGVLIDEDGEYLSDELDDATEFICTAEHAIACVNALSGIPTESLGEVKKAMIAYQFMRDECDKQVSVAIEQRKEGDDFGKLINALIDSVNQS